VAVSNESDTCRSVQKLCEQQLFHSANAYSVSFAEVAGFGTQSFRNVPGMDTQKCDPEIPE